MVGGAEIDPLPDVSLPEEAGRTGASAAPTPFICMILSKGKYNMFEPWRDSTNTLVTLLYISFIALI
jgi:hypothetical protein